MLEETIVTEYKPALEKLPTADVICSDNISELNVTDDTGSITAPFIYFFEYGMMYGLFKDLGQINKLKEENEVYALYVDNWLTYAIKNKMIQIKSDGVIEYLKRKPTFYIFKGEKNFQKLESITNTITKLAVKQAAVDSSSLSTCSFYAVKKTPELTSKYKKIVGDFFKKMADLAKESTSGLAAEEIHYLSLSTCTLNKEDLNEI